MTSGNISSYARVLNGPHQLEKIQTFNELAATMTTLKKERNQAREEASARKKQEEKDKATRRAEKEMEAINKQNELGPFAKSMLIRDWLTFSR
jgi:outer membrane murein-binding lipoprotein Lpp